MAQRPWPQMLVVKLQRKLQAQTLLQVPPCRKLLRCRLPALSLHVQAFKVESHAACIGPDALDNAQVMHSKLS